MLWWNVSYRQDLNPWLLTHASPILAVLMLLPVGWVTTVNAVVRSASKAILIPNVGLSVLL